MRPQSGVLGEERLHMALRRQAVVQVLLDEEMSGSGFSPYGMECESCGTMTQWFSLGSASEVEDAVAEEEQSDGNICFGFGDNSYDFSAREAGLAEGFFKADSD